MKRDKIVYKLKKELDAQRFEHTLGVEQMAVNMARIFGEDEQRAALAAQMKRRGQSINAEIRALLKGAGLPEDQLDARWRCDKCHDTGYVGDAPSRFCDCFEARLRLRLHEDGMLSLNIPFGGEIGTVYYMTRDTGDEE